MVRNSKLESALRPATLSSSWWWVLCLASVACARTEDGVEVDSADDVVDEPIEAPTATEESNETDASVVGEGAGGETASASPSTPVTNEEPEAPVSNDGAPAPSDASLEPEAAPASPPDVDASLAPVGPNEEGDADAPDADLAPSAPEPDVLASTEALNADDLVGSCLYDACPGCPDSCWESFDPDSSPVNGCGHLESNPEDYVWSPGGRCPRAELVAVCIDEERLRILYYYPESGVDRGSILDACDATGGVFVDP